MYDEDLRTYSYPLVCRVCGEVCPAPDLLPEEVTGWLDEHRAGTGHDAWEERPDVVVE